MELGRFKYEQILLLPADWIELIDDTLKETGERSFDTYLPMFRNETAQMWGGVENGELIGIGITRLVQYPLMLRVSIDLLCGQELAKLLTGLEVIEKWAEAQGAKGVEAWIRPALKKPVERLGFKAKSQLVVKEIQCSLH